jgi:chemotaxis protein MotB
VPARARRINPRADYWPSFVDVLTNLLLVFIFLLSIFALVQYLLSREITGQDTALQKLNAQIAQLTQMLALEKASKAELSDNLAALQASLASAQNDKAHLQSLLDAQTSAASAAGGQASTLSGELDAEKQVSARALAQVDLLNQQIDALRRQIAAVEAALDASETKDKESQAQIADLGQRLNVALAQRVQELSRYRSDFFGRLREILGDRPDIRVVGDRFVFQSEVLFPVGSDQISPDGATELGKVADAVTQLAQEIPADIGWVLQVNGHTDKQPITGSGRFKTNWDLSAARAISVVEFFVSKGIDPTHLVAAGYGEFQPLDDEDTPDAYAKNRRIELKLTER